MNDLWSHSHDWDNGYAKGHKDGYQQGRKDALEEIEKAMHEAYKGTSHQWECMIFDLKMRELKEQTE